MYKQTQQEFLEKHVAERTSVAVYLISGIKLLGSIVRFDEYAIVLSASGSEQLIYKHGIASIVPNKPKVEGGNR